ncbi:helix-turn-helix transcriptional regulator [Streptomyces xinghaiensis]|uniref:XRE family transcriptional regulator n=2 Tax=Streptomyces TaxID=1883 RepID=A0A3R7IKK9_9ACTN|nr:MULTISPECIES: helix-turn-helix transcriptional regulator [Streptomyces]KNE80143.1 XRE family transcriptional regulator [Streptomyces fradiae]OFA50977.1 transcriptional regulator [Streptomyces fradiae]PQM19527.1 XRE family transcriptional regulator [Streptomyces xinghaiensis]RKM90951.1 XRE family transcriptional regulator [Streptomyces xinghaiensis]RNC68952.1 XRE family transcriptional regulator [Streptomyces xinghaiensis]
MLEETETIGQRIRRARLRLGLTQADLAAELNCSQGWVSRLERGRNELDRTSLINEVANALHLHPNDLIERPYAGSVASHQWEASARAILRELRRYDLTPVFDGAPPPSEALWVKLEKLHKLRDAAANTKILQELPDLLREARALIEVSQGREQEEAFAIYGIGCKFAHTAAHALGHPELITMSCERAGWAAQRSGDELMPAVADWMRVWDMWATADWSDAIALSDKALRSIENPYEQGDPLALRVWGSLQLRAAVSAARGRNREEADHRIGLAREAAKRAAAQVPKRDRHSLTFSPSNVGIHAVNVALEVGDHHEALLRHEKMTDPALATLPKSRQGYYRMDLARAYLWGGDRRRAVRELEKAESTAPQLIRNHPIARATLRRIVHQERAALREQLRRMSARFHLDD